jgi:hypothetical protein
MEIIPHGQTEVAMWGQLQLGKERPSKQVGILYNANCADIEHQNCIQRLYWIRFLPLYSDKDVFRGLSLGTNGRVL